MKKLNPKKKLVEEVGEILTLLEKKQMEFVNKTFITHLSKSMSSADKIINRERVININPINNFWHLDKTN